MTSAPDFKRDRAAEIQTATREAIASQITAGAELARMRLQLPVEEFGPWCDQTCGLSLAHAELLIRWAQARPHWIDPLQVDLAAPGVDGLLDAAVELASRRHRGHGAPDAEEVA